MRGIKGLSVALLLLSIFIVSTSVESKTPIPALREGAIFKWSIQEKISYEYWDEMGYYHYDDHYYNGTIFLRIIDVVSSNQRIRAKALLVSTVNNTEIRRNITFTFSIHGESFINITINTTIQPTNVTAPLTSFLPFADCNKLKEFCESTYIFYNLSLRKIWIVNIHKEFEYDYYTIINAKYDNMGFLYSMNMYMEIGYWYRRSISIDLKSTNMVRKDGFIFFLILLLLCFVAIVSNILRPKKQRKSRSRKPLFERRYI